MRRGVIEITPLSTRSCLWTVNLEDVWCKLGIFQMGSFRTLYKLKYRRLNDPNRLSLVPKDVLQSLDRLR